MLRAIIQELDALLRLFPARRTVLLALDGPGPEAKLLEQRKRRIDKVTTYQSPRCPHSPRRPLRPHRSQGFLWPSHDMQLTQLTNAMLRRLPSRSAGRRAS